VAEGAKTLVLPKPLEPVRAELGVAHGVRDVLVAETLVDRAPCRATLPEAWSSFSTSSGLKYSLERLEALEVCAEMSAACPRR
jgi:hypothetical protein